MKELINLRKEREKHYLNEDGTITAYMYDEDIHYLDNGEYKEIDNSLIEEDEYITNKNNNFKIKLYKNKYLVNIDLDNDNYLNIKLKNGFGVNAKQENNKVIYEDVLPNIDFHYLVHGKSLKENIYLKDKINTNIIFDIETNLELVIENNKIKALNKDKNIYTFDSLFMKDSNNIINENCHYELSGGNGKYEITLKLDQAYLENASYPVLVDPSINTENKNNVDDITLFSQLPDHVADRLDFISVGSDEYGIFRSLLKFDLPSIATGDNIINATMYIKPKNSHIFEITKPIGIYEVTTNWSETTATWNNMSNNYNPKTESYITPPQVVIDENSKWEVNLTNLVKEWYSGKANNGIMLKCLDESYSNNTQIKDSYSFYSKTYDAINGTAKRAYLTIDYRDQNGLLDYMTYESISISKGSCFINNCTGNLTTQIFLNEILENNSLINLSLTYNTHDVLTNSDFGLGLGFNLAYNENIIENANTYMGKEYKYTSSDGSTHYFYKNEIPPEDESGTPIVIYKDEDGLGLTLEIVNEEAKEYNIVDKSGNKFLFTNGYLSKIEYVDETFILVTRNTENRITKLSDSKNNEINITYEASKITIVGKKNIVINLTNNLISAITIKDDIISIKYDGHSLISKINDISGMSVGFDYYETNPYKVKKVTQYGLNNTVGKHKTFEYGFYTTTVTDNNNQKYRYSFNRVGNTTSTMLVSKDGTLKNTIGFSESYVNELGTPNTNKLQSETLPLIYSENLLSNSSLEDDSGGLFKDYRSNEAARTGLYSAKIIGDAYSEEICPFDINKTYTFSSYIKNSNSAKIMLSFIGTHNTATTLEYEIPPSEDFERFEIIFHTDDNYRSSIGVSIYQEEENHIFIDDIQVEEGEIANTYNMIANGNFKDGINGWLISGRDYNTGIELTNTHELITLESNENALKLGSCITGGCTLSKTISMNGKKGDVYTLSFMYKNEGVLDGGDMVGNFAHLNFGYPEDPDGLYNHGTYDVYLNYHSKEWQMYNETFVAEEDYNSITIDVLSINEINNIYVTNFSLVKDLGNYSYKYDDEGNLISTYDVINNKTEFKYDKNNELTSMFDAKGNNFRYEYDNKITDRVLKGISPTGISNEMKYDSHGNVIKTIINNVNPKGSELSGNYYIRSKGTNKYITPNLKTGEIILKDDICSHYSYTVNNHIEKETNEENIIETKVYTFNSSILPKYTLSRMNDTISLVKNGISTNFELIKKNNGSNYLKIYKKDLYLKVTDDNKLTLTNIEEGNPSFEFYFEDTDTNEFIETSAKYTEDGKYITEVTDSLGKRTTYKINPTTGLTSSITNPIGIEFKYLYDDKDRVKSVEVDNKKVEYTYDNNLIKTIKNGNKTYSFEYDNFLNNSKVKLNNNTLIINEYYENNGQLKSVTYGNGDKINYTYDEFNRLKSYGEFYNVYNNLGLLTQVSRVDNIYEKYYYDFAKRLSTYIYLDKFKLNYKYDENSNVNHKDFTLKNDTYKIDYEFNEDDSVIKVKFDNNSLNYDYDYLGRLKSRNINGCIPEYFTYKRNGEKTSLVVDTMKIGEDVYKYIYDDLYNITEILKNNETQNKYKYDNRRQLLSDENYDLNKRYVYTYDNEGNILTKQEYNLETNDLIKTNRFEYGNTSWEDQLTKFNNETITYDAIGNPLAIGSKLLTWSKGRQLSSYKDGNTEFNYIYNPNGIRTVKEFDNGSYINYYLEGNKIIFEERCSIINDKKETNMLYYIYDDSASVLGFKYNATLYYYQKNYQNDIIGIYDSNYNLVVTYKYDAWGKVISVNDTTENNIGTINPFRYRSYYYDEETKLYYLNSRYYNPEWCRFINADKFLIQNRERFLGNNQYIYCANNCIDSLDSTGFGLFKTAIRQLWKGVCFVLDKIGMNMSSDALKHSLSDKPKTVDYSDNKKVVKKVKKDPAIRKSIESRKESVTKESGPNTEVIQFTTTDLQGMMMHASVTMTATDNPKIFNVTVHDRYDFSYEGNYYDGYADSPKEFAKMMIFTIGNNLAWVSQYPDVINNYDIYISFEYEVE